MYNEENELTQGGGQIFDINIEEHMKTAYINYSMSVIVSRALPDVRDGLKPVHTVEEFMAIPILKHLYNISTCFDKYKEIYNQYI